jgi:putative tricarboxylic transport membrane protein
MNKERGGSLIFLAAGIYGTIFSIQLPLGRWNQPGPAVFPLSISILLCVFGVSWFFRGKGTAEKKGTVGPGEFLGKFITPMQIVALTAAFILSFNSLGYLLASMLYLFVLFLWVSHYRFWAALGLAIAFGAGSWLFFGKVLTTSLPKGFLPL